MYTSTLGDVWLWVVVPWASSALLLPPPTLNLSPGETWRWRRSSGQKESCDSSCCQTLKNINFAGESMEVEVQLIRGAAARTILPRRKNVHSWDTSRGRIVHSWDTSKGRIVHSWDTSRERIVHSWDTSRKKNGHSQDIRFQKLNPESRILNLEVGEQLGQAAEDVFRINLSHIMYSLISFRKSTPPQNRQLIVHYY